MEEDFVEEVKEYTIFKESPDECTGKDLDCFIEPSRLVDFEISIKKCFDLAKCYFTYFHLGGLERRYITYDKGNFKLVDLQIGGYFKHGKRIVDYDYLKKGSEKGVLRSVPYGGGVCFRRRKDFFKRLMKRIFSSQGSVIVLLGPDGVGKSSIAKVLKEKLGVGFNCEMRYFGWGCFGPFMRLVYKFYKKKNGKVVSLGKKNFIKSVAYYLEMYVRYLGVWFRKKFFNRIIILDRFFLKPKGFFIPKPDFVFLLKANPKIILARKKELDEKKINDYYEGIDKYCFIEIDADLGIETIIESILDRVAPSLINKKEVLE